MLFKGHPQFQFILFNEKSEDIRHGNIFLTKQKISPIPSIQPI